MKHIHLFFIAIIILPFSFCTFAQDDVSPIQLKENIKIAFDNFKIKDSVSLESDLEEEVKANYVMNFVNLKPEYFNNKDKARELIQYYSTSDGIEEILHGWKMQADSLDVLLPIGNYLFQNIYLGSEKSDEITRNNLPASDANTSDSPKSVESAPRKPLDKTSAEKGHMIGKHIPQGATQTVKHQDVNVQAMETKRMETVADNHTALEKERAVFINYDKNERTIKKFSPKKMEIERLAAVVRLQNTLPTTDTRSQQTVRMLTTNTKNKYATLIINEPDKPEAEIYLDGKFIDELVKIKNGILVRSKHLYEYEIKLEDAIYCKDTITLAPKEKKTTMCKND